MRSVMLVLGPVRSGKSEWAETLAAHSGKAVVYVATAQSNPEDPEWQARIEAHQQRRPPTWSTVQGSIDLAEMIATADDQTCLLIDSLGTWLANLLDQSDGDWQHTITALLSGLEQTHATVILVAEETGWGIVPAYPLGRLFRDRLGDLVRRIGNQAERIYLVTAGYALDLKALGVPVPTLPPPQDDNASPPFR